MTTFSASSSQAWDKASQTQPGLLGPCCSPVLAGRISQQSTLPASSHWAGMVARAWHWAHRTDSDMGATLWPSTRRTDVSAATWGIGVRDQVKGGDQDTTRECFSVAGKGALLMGNTGPWGRRHVFMTGKMRTSAGRLCPHQEITCKVSESVHASSFHGDLHGPASPTQPPSGGSQPLLLLPRNPLTSSS